MSVIFLIWLNPDWSKRPDPQRLDWVSIKESKDLLEGRLRIGCRDTDFFFYL